MSVHELQGAGKKMQIFDVRSPDEWKEGHIPGAHHLFLPEIREKATKFDKTETDRGVLRQRLSRESRCQHAEAGRFQRCAQCAGKLAGLEESRFPSGRENQNR